MATIVPLAAADDALIEQLLDRAFGPERFARTAYRIREGTDWLPALSFAALDDEDYLAGTIQCWPVGLMSAANDGEPRTHPLVMVGPVAVDPACQGAGFGKALMLATLGALGDPASNGALPQVMIGDPEYYGRFFGFSAEGTAGWDCPGPVDPARLLVRCANPAVLPREGMLGPWNG